MKLPAQVLFLYCRASTYLFFHCQEPMTSALFLAASADLFNPWYIGEIINHVLITRDQAAFLQNILIISIVSLVSG